MKVEYESRKNEAKKKENKKKKMEKIVKMEEEVLKKGGSMKTGRWVKNKKEAFKYEDYL